MRAWARLALLGALAFGGAGVASADPEPVRGPATVGAVMELDLPELEGTRVLRLSDYPDRPVLLNFWSSDCPPCVAEMPLLFRQAVRYPKVQFWGIAVDEHFKARGFLQARTPTYPQLIVPLQTDGIMRRFGNRSGALPYTVVLDRAHRLCQATTGGVSAAWLAQALRTCAP